MQPRYCSPVPSNPHFLPQTHSPTPNLGLGPHVSLSLSDLHWAGPIEMDGKIIQPAVFFDSEGKLRMVRARLRARSPPTLQPCLLLMQLVGRAGDSQPQALHGPGQGRRERARVERCHTDRHPMP